MASMPSFSLAFQTDEHRTFTWQGTRDIAALLIHGFPGTPLEMRPVATTLYEHGWTVHAPLLSGFGEEIDSLPTRTHQDWFTGVEQALLNLKKFHQRVIIVGLSMGGALATQLASKHKIEALYLLAPFWKLNHILWHSLPVLQYAIPQFKPFKLFKPDFKDESMRKGMKGFLPQADLDDPETQRAIIEFAVPVKMFSHIRTVGERAYTVAPSVSCPVNILQGLQDELVMPTLTRQFSTRFKQVRYDEIDGTHNLTDATLASWQLVQEHLNIFAQKIG